MLHDRLTDVDDLGGTLAKAVDPQNLFGFTMEQDLQAADVHTYDLRPRQMLELRTTHFVRHLHGRQLLLGFTYGADFRNGVDTGWDIFNQVRRSFPFDNRLCGNTALIVGG